MDRLNKLLAVSKVVVIHMKQIFPYATQYCLSSDGRNNGCHMHLHTFTDDTETNWHSEGTRKDISNVLFEDAYEPGFRTELSLAHDAL